uniref:Uncharacterized protein n=1 Tax=Physcomitrium patens TaxID=3218 RepID=A0A2K1JW16_PHYPA|nr:hypothetical protein PHYPA_015487 [Physcomitrium patens]
MVGAGVWSLRGWLCLRILGTGGLFWVLGWESDCVVLKAQRVQNEGLRFVSWGSVADGKCFVLSSSFDIRICFDRLECV